jgi:hypothetical protein
MAWDILLRWSMIMEIKTLKKILSEHKKWLKDNLKGTRADLYGANLTGANLTRADLSGADLTGANLTRANLDFSSFPLWCGGSRFKVDQRLVRQLLAHICTLEITDADDDTKKVMAAILPEAQKSHRAVDLRLAEASK